MRTLALVSLAAFFSALAMAVAEEGKGPKTNEVTGQVVFACPKGHAVKIKKDEKTELTLLVYPKCPKRSELEKQIKSLEKGTTITATYFTCPKSKKNYVTKIVEPKKEEENKEG